jgi:hypothetical protein
MLIRYAPARKRLEKTMKRPLFAAVSLLLLAGCASTGSNYYSYEGSGDYYYGSPQAGVVIDSSPYGYGSGGYVPGFGFGYGYGYGYGYGSPYSYWGYGYQPIWTVPSVPYQDPALLRSTRVERDRAVRSGLVRRDTVQAPESAAWLSARSAPRSTPGVHDWRPERRAPAQTRMQIPDSARQPVSARGAPMAQPRPAMPRAVHAPAPIIRSTPPPRPPSHRQ